VSLLCVVLLVVWFVVVVLCCVVLFGVGCCVGGWLVGFVFGENVRRK